MSGFSPLTPITPAAFASSLLLLQLDQSNQLRLQREQNRINSGLSKTVNAINRQADAVRELRRGLAETMKFIEDTIQRIERIKVLSDRLRTEVFNSQFGDSLSFGSHEAAFNAFLRQIIDTADKTNQSPNLLGDTPQSDFTYFTTVSGQSRTITRTSLSSDYTITDSGGFIWQPDRTSQLLRQIDPATGARTGTFASITGGLRLDSFNSATNAITFTISPDTAGAQTFSGTLSRSGLGIVDAFFYDGLETAQGRTRATNDLIAAATRIDFELGRYQSELTTVRFQDDRSAVQLDGFGSQINAATTASLLKIQEADNQAQQQGVINAAIVEGNRATRAEYLKFLGGGATSGLFGALIDIVA